jgi:hypothetical protein
MVGNAMPEAEQGFERRSFNLFNGIKVDDVPGVTVNRLRFRNRERQLQNSIWNGTLHHCW